jgi:hypothetical protein
MNHLNHGMPVRTSGTTGIMSSVCHARRMAWPAALALSVAWLVSACGGSSTGAAAGSDSNALVLPAVVTDASGNASVDSAAVGVMSLSASANASTLPVADPGLLLLLLPDTQDPQDARVQAWLDAALEEGVRVAPVSDSQFLQLGDAAQSYAGLILPDSLHVQATDTLVSAVQQYVEQGGKAMLVFDFGALTLLGDVPVYPVPRSRLSPLAGVDYVLYEALRDRTTGLGPVVGSRSTLRSLLVPPGKSMALPALASTASSDTLQASATVDAGSSPGGLLAAAGVSDRSALYLPVSAQDPGGVRGFDVQQYSQQRYFSNASSLQSPLRAREVKIDLGQARRAEPVSNTSRLLDSAVASSALQTVSAQSTADPQEAWSGYLLGPLMYPSYVTQGDFGQLPGQRVLASSPQFGLVAGINPVGKGQVLFVNLPLTYLKGRTDALMMHGFLHLFTREVLDLPHLSSMPNGVAGITLDWHLDAMEAQAPTQKLVKLKVFNDPKVLFSMEMTAGPDAIKPGDKLGWNLPRNKTAQQLLRSFAATGHAIGSHGGWIHDYYGIRVSETNRLQSTGGACVNSLVRLDNYEQCLVLNRQAVDGVVGRPSMSYSAPEGNNPLWAMDWLEQRGVVAAYFGGHTGLGATRQYRDGQLLNPALWVFPVTPQGLYATFEEFQAYMVPQADVIAWYHALVDFCVAQNTSRMVYAHPAGAAAWSNVLLDFLGYAKAQSPRLSWYTTLRLARFMGQRQQVSWTQSVDANSGKTVFTASHPTGLAEMTWRLPRSRFAQAPQVLAGQAVVDTADARYWQVRATGGTQLSFAL